MRGGVRGGGGAGGGGACLHRVGGEDGAAVGGAAADHAPQETLRRGVRPGRAGRLPTAAAGRTPSSFLGVGHEERYDGSASEGNRFITDDDL